MPRNHRHSTSHAPAFGRAKVTARPTRPLAWAAAGLVSGLCAFVGCSSNDLQRCDAIPEGGCPLGRGGTCDDAACRALYECVQGRWSMVARCGTGQGGDSGHGAGGQGGAAGAAGSAGTAGAASCSGVELDHTGETQGCAPELELPDCPASAAESCQPCLTGCADFYMCLADGWGWVAYCTEDSELVLVR